jgi:hypothetical protein
MGKLRVLVILFVAAALLSCSVSKMERAYACSPGPAVWIGSAKVNDTWVPAGTAISAWINGAQVGETTTGSVSGSQAWEFLIEVRSDDPTTPAVEGGYLGDIVHFKIKRASDVGWLEAAIDPPGDAVFVWENVWAGVLLTAASNPSPATLEGQVDLQDRPAPPDPTWETPLTVKFFEPGTNNVIRTEDVTTDGQGNFTVADVASGFYDIGVKCPRSLSRLVTGVGFAGGATVAVDFGTLREGDANNDDVINGLDYAVLWSSFGQTTGEALDKCDFNRDGAVTGADYSFLWNDFDQVGDMYGM